MYFKLFHNISPIRRSGLPKLDNVF